MAYVEANGISIYYEQRGEGAPVLFVNGTGADLRVKPNVLDGPLCQKMKVLTFDQRGLGQTDKPEIDYTMEMYADDAAELMKVLGLKRAHIVGHSFGGMVALHLAIRHADLVDRLVLSCTSPGGQHPSYPFHELPEGLTSTQRLLRLMGINDTRKDEQWQKQNPDMVQKMIDYTVAHAIDEHSSPEFQAGANRQLAARIDHDVESSLASIGAKTLICAGKYDGVAPVANQQVLLDGIKNSEVRWFEGGHMMLIQDKSAWQEIIEFLN